MKSVNNLKIFNLLEKNKPIRVVAFGSSNTQRFDVGMHWFDYVELGFKNKWGGGCGQFINSGIGGQTSNDLLMRFDNELARYEPNLVFITIGGNDCNPLRNIRLKQYRNNLLELVHKVKELNSNVIFQTYYACDIEHLLEQNPGRADMFEEYMEVIVEVAMESNCVLFNHYSRWEKLRLNDVKTYRSLMRDSLHVNALGNMIMGIDLIRFLNTLLLEDQLEYCKDGFLIQSFLDKLNK